MQSLMMRGSSSGRTASWNSTMQSSPRGSASDRSCDRLRRRGDPVRATLEDARHLAVPAALDEAFRCRQMARRHHDDDLVNVGMKFEGVKRVFYDRLSGDLQ